MALQYCKGTYKKDGDRLFNRACCSRTKCNSFEFKDNKFSLDGKNECFMMGVMKRWNRLPREAVDVPSWHS